MAENEQTPETEPEPEGVLEVEVGAAKQKVVPVGVLAAERRRVKESTEQKIRAELEPLKAHAAENAKLKADLATLQPYIDHLRANPDLMKKAETPDVQAISDEEAEAYARNFELYTANGVDVARAKKIIAHNRKETERVATEAAHRAVQPAMAMSATQQSRANFLQAVQKGQQRGLDPQILAEVWAKVPADLSQNPEVAEHLLRTAIGDAALAGKLTPPTEREPVYSESPGGGRSQTYQQSELEKRVARHAGISEADWQKSASTFKPDAVNVLGD